MLSITAADGSVYATANKFKRPSKFEIIDVLYIKQINQAVDWKPM
jgi:hypothetical protein